MKQISSADAALIAKMLRDAGPTFALCGVHGGYHARLVDLLEEPEEAELRRENKRLRAEVAKYKPYYDVYFK